MEKNQILIDHLDNSLEGNDSSEIDQLIANDTEAAREWYFLQVAVDAIQDAGLNEQVASVRSEWKRRQTLTTAPRKGMVRQISGNIAKIAAILVMMAGGAAFYKYATISSGSLYDKYYTSYDLNTSRGAG